jgi:flagellar motor switch protein FliN/FliY
VNAPQAEPEPPDGTPEDSLAPSEGVVEAGSADAIATEPLAHQPDVAKDTTPPEPAERRQAERRTAARSAAENSGKSSELARLPHYSRSLLKIRVPISVQLASKKETVQEVVGLAPGSIIKFEKGCDELLQMIIGEQAIAEGEAVKVGEKFGFRVTSMLMPREHFVPVRRPRSA